MSFNPHRLKTEEIKSVTRFFKVTVEKNKPLHMSLFRPHDSRTLLVRVHAADHFREIGRIDSRGFFTPNATTVNEAQQAKTAIEALLPHLYNQGQQLDRLGSLCKLTQVKLEAWDGFIPDPIESVFLADADRILAAIAAG